MRESLHREAAQQSRHCTRAFGTKFYIGNQIREEQGRSIRHLDYEKYRGCVNAHKSTRTQIVQRGRPLSYDGKSVLETHTH